MVSRNITVFSVMWGTCINPSYLNVKQKSKYPQVKQKQKYIHKITDRGKSAANVYLQTI